MRDFQVHLIVYDILGREVAMLINEAQPAGHYEVTFDGNGLSSGLHIFRLTVGSYTASRQMLLLK